MAFPAAFPLSHDRLRDDALAARTVGDHDAAIAAWRRLLDRAPDDWRVALELKHDLRQGLHNPDSDPRFCRAARGLPDAEWLAHYAGSALLPGSELEAIAFRAHEMRERNRTDARLEALLGQVARQRRDWAEAARAFAAASRLAPDPAWLHLAAEARQYERLRHASMDAHAVAPAYAAYAAYVINLDGQDERLAEFRRQCSGFPLMPQRVPAVAGGQLAAAAVERLTGSRTAPRGTLGCFLSHAAAWDRLLAGPAPCALVLEDDALPLLPFPATLDALKLPAGWDLVWVNERMQARHDPDATTGFSTATVAAALAGFAPGQDAAGTDGYLISRAGARKLLDWTAADGFAGNVDWRMAAYALSPADAARLPAAVQQGLAENAAPNPRADRLAAYALHPALVREIPLQSDRQDIDRAGRLAA